VGSPSEKYVNEVPDPYVTRLYGQDPDSSKINSEVHLNLAVIIE
jgi:hypothetical protein